MIVRIVRALASSKGLFAAAVLAGVVSGLGLAFGNSSHTVIAQFSNVNGLVGGNEVRIGGIEVGSVQSLQVSADAQTGQQSAVVSFTVDSEHWPLREGTTVAVRPKGVLSNVYVAVDPGSPQAPSLGDNPRFDVNHTSSPVNLDELSNIFDPSVRTSIRTQLQEGVIVFGGTGISDFNQTIANLNPLTADAVPITSVLGQRSPELDRLNFEFNKISGDLAREDNNLRGLIVNGEQFLGVLASHQVSLQGTLLHAAGTLTSLDQGLKGEESNLASIFQKGPNALNQAKTSADLLAPLISRVDPYIADLDVLLHEFITATGYVKSGTNNAWGFPLDNLRVDGSLPPSDRSANACGGTPENHC
ncbi:MAG: MlaD family protein [Candidatus Dormibacteraeota bacterium]|nr:MlaD family protein [Candidatus Dormibacteraeota bacterium]